jgi:methylthioribose-1-phosphate isomerase
MYIQAVRFENDELKIIDQTRIPNRLEYIKLDSIEKTVEALQKLKVRGAPAIGITAAYALYIEAKKRQRETGEIFRDKMEAAAQQLENSRPTAVNLRWAVDHMRCIYNEKSTIDSIVKRMREQACAIHEEDRNACRQMGMHGLAIIPKDPCTILTHCNTGSLATGGWGTALGVVYAAWEKGYQLHVCITETRPLGQGARLTFFELMQHKIPCTLLADSAAASLMAAGKIDLVLFGADRIAYNGDVANKIGTYALAALAQLHAIPCYVVAPVSSFDFTLDSGADIPIEQRQADEILALYSYQKPLPEDAQVHNPAFDITRAEYLSGIITENGIIRKPVKHNMRKKFKLKREELL